LAGRLGTLNLLPFSIDELQKGKMLPKDDDDLMIKGFYPPVYDQEIPTEDWCPNYVKTYIEKDVRQIKNITELLVFERFIRLLAGRSGQELNNSALAVETGVDVKTVQSWIGILESSFIVYLLKPHHQNFKKTLVKRPKLYFYDTSLVCYLLRIRTRSQLESHPLRGAIFEGMVVTELVKKRTNAGLEINLFYWRDKTGHEVDVIIDNGRSLIPVEIKSGRTIAEHFFKNLNFWTRLSGEKKSFLLYGGSENQLRSDGKEIQNWRKLIGRDL
jgi:predicted AAA+ superfamily ATPase